MGDFFVFLFALLITDIKMVEEIARSIEMHGEDTRFRQYNINHSQKVESEAIGIRNKKDCTSAKDILILTTYRYQKQDEGFGGCLMKRDLSSVAVSGIPLALLVDVVRGRIGILRTHTA